MSAKRVRNASNHRHNGTKDVLEKARKHKASQQPESKFIDGQRREEIK